MRHIMVVADETIVGTHVTKRLHELNAGDPCDVFLVVTAAPHGNDEDIDRATDNLAAGLAAIEPLGIQVTGRVGQADPMAAIGYGLRMHPGINLVVLSTGPLGAERWLSLDLPHRVRRRFDIAVEHIVGTPLDTAPAPHVEDRPVKILLVEDDDADVELAKVALDELDTETEVLVSRTGAQALEYIEEASPPPDLILLDLKMPVMDGFAMLEEFESKLGLDAFNELNVVVVSSSAAEADRERAHALGAHSYIVKQPDFDQFRAALASLVDEILDHQVARR